MFEKILKKIALLIAVIWLVVGLFLFVVVAVRGVAEKSVVDELKVLATKHEQMLANYQSVFCLIDQKLDIEELRCE